MKLIVDASLSPLWCVALDERGVDAVHWSTVGDVRASDRQILAWARTHGCVVFTHDLDFGALLANTQESGPSVLQIRTQDVMPDKLADLVVAVLRQHAAAIGRGALVTIDALRARVRVLPIRG
jgi:predicted nuclease of predicted toxin-antitoxin system